jgi:hypothetical protein
MPDVQFIWRLHPSTSYAALTQQNPQFFDLPPNTSFSTRSLQDDIDLAHWSLYRGSTAIVQAAVSGVHPVYLHQAGEISIDTLYEIADLREHVVEPEDFKRLVLLGGSHIHNIGKIQDYCESIYVPMTASVLAELIV